MSIYGISESPLKLSWLERHHTVHLTKYVDFFSLISLQKLHYSNIIWITFSRIFGRSFWNHAYFSIYHSYFGHFNDWFNSENEFIFETTSKRPVCIGKTSKSFLFAIDSKWNMHGGMAFQDLSRIKKIKGFDFDWQIVI